MSSDLQAAKRCRGRKQGLIQSTARMDKEFHLMGWESGDERRGECNRALKERNEKSRLGLAKIKKKILLVQPRAQRVQRGLASKALSDTAKMVKLKGEKVPA